MEDDDGFEFGADEEQEEYTSEDFGADEEDDDEEVSSGENQDYFEDMDDF